MLGSAHNDRFAGASNGLLRCQSNHAGGTLGGISSGEPIVMRVAIKPASSISQDRVSACRPPCGQDPGRLADAAQRPDVCTDLWSVCVLRSSTGERECQKGWVTRHGTSLGLVHFAIMSVMMRDAMAACNGRRCR